MRQVDNCVLRLGQRAPYATITVSHVILHTCVFPFNTSGIHSQGIPSNDGLLGDTKSVCGGDADVAGNLPLANDEGVIDSELLVDGLEYDEAAEEPQLELAACIAGCFLFGIGIELEEDDMIGGSPRGYFGGLLNVTDLGGSVGFESGLLSQGLEYMLQSEHGGEGSRQRL